MGEGETGGERDSHTYAHSWERMAIPLHMSKYARYGPAACEEIMSTIEDCGNLAHTQTIGREHEK